MFFNECLNFTVKKKTVPPVIQAVMIGTEDQHGLSFTTEGLVIGETNLQED
ncbi:MAG: DUF3124 domain-containing protein [Bacteroidales bacterium]